MSENSTFFGELFQFGPYKRTQGKIMRQATFFGLLLIFVAGAWTLHNEFSQLTNMQLTNTQGWMLFLGVSAVGAWISYRLVNVARFADFLIHVEGEFNKISWPSQTDLYKSVLVVIFVMVMLAMIMWAFDAFWQIIFIKVLKIIRPPSV